MQDFINEFENSIKIQKSSSSLLLMNVEDILGYAQIKANKFNKIIKKINIKKSVEDIIQIQQYQADSLNITLKAQFMGFPFKENSNLMNYVVEGDEMRIK